MTMVRARGPEGPHSPSLALLLAVVLVLAALALGASVWWGVGVQLAEIRETPPEVADLFDDPRSVLQALAVACGVLIVPAIGAVGGIVLAVKDRRPILGRSLSLAALAATGQCALLLLFGGIRAFTRPSVASETRHLGESTQTLPPPGILREIDVRSPAGQPIAMKKRLVPGPVEVRRTSMWDLTVVHDCAPSGCRIGVFDGAETPEDAGAPAVPEPAPFQRWDETLLVTRDQETGTLYLHPPGGRVRAELRHTDGRWVPMGFSASDIGGRAAPPWPWLLAALLSLAVAAPLWRWGHAAKKHEAALEGATAGVLGDDGWLVLDGGATARLDASARIAPGPVLVVGNRTEDGAYRDRPLSAREVLSGTLEEHRERALRGRIGRGAAVLAACVLSAAPLAAAVPLGLVLPFGGAAREPLASESALLPSAPPDKETPVPHPDWRFSFQAVDVVKIDGDAEEDAIGDCDVVHAGSGVNHVEHFPCAVDGRTMRRTWVAPSAGMGHQGVLARVGNRVLARTLRTRLQVLDLSTGERVLTFEQPPRGADVCVPDPEGSVVWLGAGSGGGAELDLRTGRMTERTWPPECPSRWISRCVMTEKKPCGPAPTDAETATLDQRGIQPHAFLRTDASLLVMGSVWQPATRRSGVPPKPEFSEPVVGALDPSTSALLWLTSASGENLLRQETRAELARRQEMQFASRLPDGRGGPLPSDNAFPALHWRASTGAATVVGGVLFLTYVDDIQHVAAIDVATGQRLWDRGLTRGEAPFLVSNGRLYARDDPGLAVIDTRSGVVLGWMTGK